jgi:hypothetical protein
LIVQEKRCIHSRLDRNRGWSVDVGLNGELTVIVEASLPRAGEGRDYAALDNPENGIPPVRDVEVSGGIDLDA